jgi:hypothetical protein
VPTALDIIQDALELIGVYGPGDSISAADSGRVLSVLNDMLDSWSNESLTCFAWSTQSFNMVSGQSQYTIGANGFINATRPLKIMDSPGSAYLLDDQGNKYLMRVLDQISWNQQTTAAANAVLPDRLFYDPQFPFGIINIYPIPSVTYVCCVTVFQQLLDLASLQTTISLPPGYKRAITTNLAVAAKPYFTASQLDPDVREEARQTKGAIKRTNMRTQVAGYDPELVSKGQGGYNIYSDSGSNRT